MGLETNDESEEEKEDGDEIEKFSIEYSKSNRSKCKKCLTKIDKVTNFFLYHLKLLSILNFRM